MDLFKLEIFIAVLGCGSYTGAARRLGISQPAVSQNVAALERELGVRLFSRAGCGGAKAGGDTAAGTVGGGDAAGTIRGEGASGGGGERRMLPTKAAEVFRPYALRILQAHETAATVFNPAAARYSTVRIHADPLSFETVVPRLLPDLRAIWPDIRFEALALGAGPSDDTPQDGRDPAFATADVIIKTGTSLAGDSMSLSFDVSGPEDNPFIGIVHSLIFFRPES